MSAYRRWGKRSLDLLLLLAGLPIVLPIMLFVALVVRLRMGSPVLFKHVRPGYKGAPFELLKFRTMTNARDSAGSLLPDEVRLTLCGQLLRRLSLDELPQLWNVLRGDLSLVGPRPLMTKYLDRYSPEQSRRHEVLPGITGWAQVNGRNAISWEQKFELDVWYVDHCGIWLDLKILVLTLVQVLRQRGISQTGYVTSPEFMGQVKRAATNECRETANRLT